MINKTNVLSNIYDVLSQLKANETKISDVYSWMVSILDDYVEQEIKETGTVSSSSLDALRLLINLLEMEYLEK